ncbi:MAG TPA: hypothetical protein VLG46_05150, partial [Anaerolineae bacterium]|nr:hypothetical protein [Anaerolineae bacterium]
MSHSHKPLPVIVISGLLVIFLLLVGSAGSRASYDHFLYLPMIVHQATPTPTPTSWISCHLKGAVMAAVTPAIPISGATISYTHRQQGAVSH